MDDEVKQVTRAPALFMTGGVLAIRAGTSFGNATFDVDTEVTNALQLEAGADYFVRTSSAAAELVKADGAPDPEVFGGFHFAPGGNAPARAGGDAVPAINPFSLWDVGFRPSAPDPRGMAYVDPALVPFPSIVGPSWKDIYPLAQDHLAGTSRFGAVIADGNSPPQAFDGRGTFARFDYATAVAVLAHHGKQPLSYDEFRVAAYGVTEKTAIGSDPLVTGLDAPRTSRFGLMQATGNVWQWGHDGDPDDPRASLFGGHWWGGGFAGSRQASVAYDWPGVSDGSIGARGRCDHLQPV